MASSKSLQQAIANIKIWHKGEQRAPHKPLLLLYILAEYLNGHPRLFDYGSEIYEPLHSLLERFGPQRSQYRPDMPFWRLQATDSGNYTMPSVAQQQGAADNRQ